MAAVVPSTMQQVLQHSVKLPAVLGGGQIRTVVVGGGLLSAYTMYRILRRRGYNGKRPKRRHDSKRKGPRVNPIKQLKKLIALCLKSGSTRWRVAAIVALTLAGTAVRDRHAHLQGGLFSAVFKKDKSWFLKLLAEAALMDFIMSGFTSTLSYMVGQLTLHWRQRLSKHIMDRYFTNMNYYRLSFTDKRIAQPEELIVNDLPKFVTALGDVTQSLIAGVIDGTYFTWRLAQALGPGWASGGWLYVVIAVVIVQSLAPNYAKMVAKRQELNGEFRHAFGHVVGNSEAIAAYDGDQRERHIVTDSFYNLWTQAGRVMRVQYRASMLQDFMYKYLGATCAAVMIVGPFFNIRQRKGKEGSLQATSALLAKMRYVTSVIINQLVAIGGLAAVVIKLTQAAGYAKRLGYMLNVLEDLNNRNAEQKSSHLQDSGDVIAFKDVQVVTPTGNVLVSGLTFEVRPGTNMLLTGANGAGKSSLFRCLGGLWEVHQGTIYKPTGVERSSTKNGHFLVVDGNNVQGSVTSKDGTTTTTPKGTSAVRRNSSASNSKGLFGNVFYIPQKPYNVIGSLRDQLTYPQTAEEVAREGKTLSQQQLEDLLDLVDLGYLAERSTDNDVNWEAQLSIGETQRLAMARLLFHKPVFAVLDECTSGVPSAMEKRLYQLCQERNITCITISHRPALEQYHHMKLSLDGKGSYSLVKLDPSSLHRSTSLSVLKAVNVGTRSRKGSSAERKSSGSVRSPQPSPTQEEAPCFPPLKQPPYNGDSTPWGRLKRIMGILVPSITDPTALKLMLLSGIVVGRVTLSNFIAHLNGNTVAFLLNNDLDGFKRLISIGAFQSMISAVLAPSLVYLSRRVALDWRERLTKHMFRLFFKAKSFYKVLHLYRDVQQPEQRLSQDIEEMCVELGHLFPDVVKPVVDIAWYSYVTKSLLGWKNTAYLYVYMMAGLGFLKLITPDFSAMTSRTQELEGSLRYVHSRLRTHAESVAFFGGGLREGKIIDSHFSSLVKHVKHVLGKSWLYDVVDNFIVKRLPAIVTWMLSLIYSYRMQASMAVTVAVGSAPRPESNKLHARLAHDLRYVASAVSHTFLAFGELLQLYKSFQQLSGYVERVAELEEVLVACVDAAEAKRSQGVGDVDKGRMVQGNSVEFKDVDVVDPTGNCLAKDLSFHVQNGQNLLITGFTGAGKTSLFRVLCGLWPLRGGTIVKPFNATERLDLAIALRTDTSTNSTTAITARESPVRTRFGVFFVPQKPYNVLGTLADLVTYPEPADYYVQHDEARLLELLKVVRVDYLLEREGGWNARAHWSDVLSLGEQQRIGMARLFFHRPQFAVLDQCTDAVSVDVEEELYVYARSLGITILTISQRPGLLNLHSQSLKLVDGMGSWELDLCTAE